jgi:hypothetical protein
MLMPLLQQSRAWLNFRSQVSPSLVIRRKYGDVVADEMSAAGNWVAQLAFSSN